MNFALNNPLPIISLNVLGVGVDIAYGKTVEKTSDGVEMSESVITLVVNFLYGSYSKTWLLK